MGRLEIEEAKIRGEAPKEKNLSRKPAAEEEVLLFASLDDVELGVPQDVLRSGVADSTRRARSDPGGSPLVLAGGLRDSASSGSPSRPPGRARLGGKKQEERQQEKREQEEQEQEEREEQEREQEEANIYQSIPTPWRAGTAPPV